MQLKVMDLSLMYVIVQSLYIFEDGAEAKVLFQAGNVTFICGTGIEYVC